MDSMDPIKLQFIQSALQIAESWEAKGSDRWENRAWATRSLSSALMKLLSIAVTQFSTQTSAVTWLAENDARAVLQRTLEHLQFLIAEYDAGRLPASAYGGNYPHLVFAHISWAIEEFSLGESFVTISKRQENLELSTPFWREYGIAMGTLVERLPYTFPELPLRGQERYWSTYLHLIEANYIGRAPTEAFCGIDEAFRKRNSDNRISDDRYEIEGSGRHAAKWDYRRDSLVTYIAYRYPFNTNVS